MTDYYTKSEIDDLLAEKAGFVADTARKFFRLRWLR